MGTGARFAPLPHHHRDRGPGSTGGHEPWTDDHVAFAEQDARPHLARVITLASNTGQRGRLIKMRWCDIETIRGLGSGSTSSRRRPGLVIWIPLTEPLAATSETWERRPTFLR